MLHEHEQALLEQMPVSLRAEIAFCVHTPIVRSVPFLKDAADDFVVDILTRMNYSACGAGECIIEAGYQSHCFFIVAHGLVEVVCRGMSLAVLGEGNYFGGAPERAALVVVCVSLALSSNPLF